MVPRYFLFLYPPAILLFVGILTYSISNKNVINCLIGIICFCFITSNVYNAAISPNFESTESSFAYIRYIYFTQNAIKYIRYKYLNAVLIAPPFLKDEMENPYWGYTENVDNIYWSNCDFLKEQKIVDNLREESDSKFVDILYLSPPFASFCPNPNESKQIEKICIDKFSDSYYCLKIYKL
jgi:hypothetical protein